MNIYVPDDCQELIKEIRRKKIENGEINIKKLTTASIVKESLKKYLS